MKAELSLEKSSLSKLIEKLAAFEPQQAPFISIYLNAQANEHGRDNFGVWLKKEFSEAGADFSDATEQSESFKADVEKITAFVDEIRPEANGAAIFACAGANFFRTAQFAATLDDNRFYVFDRPYIFPLARLIGQNPRFAVVQADTNKASIYVFGGDMALKAENADESAEVESIQNVKTQRQSQGGWSQQRFQRRIENFHDQHAKEVISTLEKLVRDEEIEMIVLAGDEARAIKDLRNNLSQQLEGKIVAEISNNQYSSEIELYEAAKAEIEKYDREQDREAVARLVNAKESSELGTYGVSKTLEALSNGQVEELLILSDTSRIRYNEENVEQVLENYAPGDDNSANDALPDTSEKRQILDELIVRAYNSSARIRFVEETSLLMAIGGVGAVLRYKF